MFKLDKDNLLTDDQKQMVRRAGATAVGGAAAVAVTSAHAILDTTATSQIKTDLDANQQAGENVGGYVVAIAIAFAVIGIIITMVKKA